MNESSLITAKGKIDYLRGAISICGTKHKFSNKSEQWTKSKTRITGYQKEMNSKAVLQFINGNDQNTENNRKAKIEKEQ